ncbi:efflux RND transporter permease subunit [Anaerobacillus alkaliphilus]|uniref:Efflux RND transporter permease subunit n=1 Tax=Anaerobacillus alkaliphilus TaxID=1548597 RepID=A0A4V1LGE8_9BACI|nr:efflux RND transporter permease subunit [Anaerobacillus alkaliphilus]RXJ00691.1 efflux RND transporter permease subunit [Anaerobacillus alkaliphilus]
MNFLRFLIQRKKLVSLMVLFIFMIGMYVAGKLDRELFPSISFDGATIYANAGQMSTLDVEQQVTKPIEQLLQNIKGIKSISSSSSVGVSSIMVEVDEGSGDEVFKEIEVAIKGLENQLTGVNHISAHQFSTDQPYEFYMTITDGEMEAMTSFAQKVLKPRLEALPEVREVGLEGIEKTNVIVELNVAKLEQVGVSPQQIIQSIQQLNVDTSVATLEKEVGKPIVRWTTSMTNIEDIKNIDILTPTGVNKIRDLANIYEDKTIASSIGWNNGTNEFIFVQIGRVKDVTQVEMAASVRKEIEKIRNEGLVNGFRFEELVAQADYVTNSIDGVSTNVVIGGIIALLILILFLRNVRATMIIGLSIPLSILLTFITMYFFDYSFNMLTLIGLGLGIGMMVDSSIVILESIYRKKEEGGLNNLEAVLTGVKEVATAVLASMLTTIVVFVPIGLLGGEMGQFMIILSMIVVITLVSSVIVAFTLIPTLSENFLKLAIKKGNREGAIVASYGNLVTWITRKKRNRYGIIALFCIIFIGSLLLITKIPMTVMPDVLNRYAEVMVQLERGLTPSEREEIALKIHENISVIEDVESNLIMDNVGAFYLLVNMTPEENATMEQSEVNEAMYRAIRELETNYRIVSVGAAGFSGPSFPVALEIKGEDFETLSTISEDLIKELSGIEGLVGITSTANNTIMEEQITFKAAGLEEHGVTTSQLFSQFQEWSARIPVGELKNDSNSPIFVTTNVAINNKDQLLNLEISTINGSEPIATFIELNKIEVPTEVTRKDGERIVTVMADIEGRDLGSINRDIEQVLNNYQEPIGYSVKTSGSLAEQKEAQQDMLVILGIAIFLVYVVMTVQFNSFIHPLIVMSIIPMTVTGALLGLLLTQSELSIMSGMGMVFLIGIVLNNAILLIDRTKQLRTIGYGIGEAIVEAGKNRMRPIFMTTLTTVGGMLPLAISSGAASNYQSPLAIVIISGLLFATLITLVLIPSVYLLFEDVKRGMYRLFKRKPVVSGAEESSLSSTNSIKEQI